MYIEIIKKKIEGKKATGTICFIDKDILEVDFISGPWGRGYLPDGAYELQWLDKRDATSYKLFDFGWFAYLHPLFKTPRTELAIHPDGGKWAGTLGCAGVLPKTKEENKRIYDIIYDGLKKQKTISVMVRRILNDTRFT